jgi:hypothetical protein
MSSPKGYREVTLDENTIATIEANTEKQHKITRQGIEGSFEVNIQKPSLWGHIWGYVYETGVGPTNIIRADRPWGVEVEWCIYGNLVQFICGKWCLRLHCESMGPGEEFDLPTGRCGIEIPMDPCKCCYKGKIEVPAGTIKPEHCGTPYKLVVTVQYLTACKDRLGAVTGFVEFPVIEFYQADAE